jgi:branched-chain amino acid transport system substrate-binding protein
MINWNNNFEIKNMNKKILVGMIAAVLVAVMAWVFLAKGKESDKKAISIDVAVNMPMTGDLSIYGESVRDGIKLAMDELKDSLDLYDIAINYDMQDNAGNAKNAVAIYKSQQLRGFDVYVSGITGQTAALLEDVKKTGKPHFIWSFYPLVLQKNQNIFRTWFEYYKQAYYFEQYLKRYKPEAKRIALLYVDVASTQELYNTLLIPNLKEKYKIVLDETYDMGTKDFKNIVAKAKQSKFDVIFVCGFKNHLIQLAKEFNYNGMKQDDNILFSFDIVDAVNDVGSDALNGYLGNIPVYEIENTDIKAQWKERFKAKYNKEANYTNAYAYDFAKIMFEIAKKYANSGEKAFDINQYIYDMELTGVTGNLKFASNGDLIGLCEICKYENGKFIPLKK